MPIDPIVLQRRHTEVGRIRLGHKADMGGGKSRPAKLDRFRFTSPNAALIDAVAELYGGEARPWDNGGLPQFEVFTTATEVPIIVVRGAMSQWMEYWSGGGCVHRCDGIRNEAGDLCENDTTSVTVKGERKRVHDLAKPTTRLSVMLRAVETMGVWRLESHGYNAAAELPNMADLAAAVSSLVPAVMRLEERRAIVDGKTSRFVVPTIDLLITKDRLLEVAGGPAPQQIEASAPDRQQIASGPATAPPAPAAAPADPPVDTRTPIEVYGPQIAACETTDDLNALWALLRERQHTFDDVVEAWKARARELTEPARVEYDTTPATDEPVDAEEVHGEPATSTADDDAAWAEVVTAAGRRGVATSELITMFEQWAGHPADDGNALEYRRFIAEALT